MGRRQKLAHRNPPRRDGHPGRECTANERCEIFGRAPLRVLAMASDKARISFRVTPMLATLVRKPFHKPGWIYEEKYDGYRILAYKEGDHVTLLSRNGNDRTATYAS